MKASLRVWVRPLPPANARTIDSLAQSFAIEILFNFLTFNLNKLGNFYDFSSLAPRVNWAQVCILLGI
jgi:hypothetical protein